MNTTTIGSVRSARRMQPVSDPQELIAELQAIAPHLATKLTRERIGFMREIAALELERLRYAWLVLNHEGSIFDVWDDPNHNEQGSLFARSKEIVGSLERGREIENDFNGYFAALAAPEGKT